MMLHFYFARRFLRALATVFGVFFILYVLVGLVDHITWFRAREAGMGDILKLTLLYVPEELYKVFPLLFLMGSLLLFLSLARSSELVVSRAAGRSAIISLLSPLAVSLLLGALILAIYNPIVAATSKEYESLSRSYKRGTTSLLSISREGLWLRQGTESTQTVIKAERSNLDGTEIFDVTFIELSKDGIPQRRIEAESAQLRPGSWELTNAKSWPLTGENPEVGSEIHETLSVPSSLTKNQIRDSFGTPSAIPIWDLPRFIQQLEAAGFSARSHRVWLHMELALPVLLMAMVMVGAGFTMRHTRFGRTGIMVLAALGLGFFVFFIRNFAQILAENGQVPILLAAWAPPLVAIMLSLSLLLHLEDG
ncbi:MAG: LPS export ABC transporter permease LptG [Rhodobacteraceae bacterium]|nr:LPS export ABC transporter permease LptG [Paracoccaceae bacterium]